MKSFYKVCLVLIMHTGIHFTRWYIKKYNDRRIVIITTSQLRLFKSELRFCTSSNPADGVIMLEISDGENIWQWSWLKYGILLVNHTTKTNYHHSSIHQSRKGFHPFRIFQRFIRLITWRSALGIRMTWTLWMVLVRYSLAKIIPID